MGTTKTRYADTNNQFAYKTDRAAFLARIRSKAEDLWIDGYRATCDPDKEPHTFLVWQENTGLAAGHKVNVAEGTCTCRFMLDQETHPLDPADPALRIKCKHLKGIKDLVAEEVTYFKGPGRPSPPAPLQSGELRTRRALCGTIATVAILLEQRGFRVRHTPRRLVETAGATGITTLPPLPTKGQR